MSSPLYKNIIKTKMVSLGLEKVSLVIIIFLSFFHSLTTQLDLILYLLVFLITIITLYRQIHRSISCQIFHDKTSLLLLIFVQYVVLNGLINCCSLINLKRILRLIFALNLYYIFSFQKVKNGLPRLLIATVTVIGIILFTISITAFFNENLWIQIWGYLLKDFGLYYQIAEKSRGRLPQVSPLQMGILFPLALSLISKNSLKQIFGLTSFMMFLSMLIFWNYRSHALTAIFGIVIFFAGLHYFGKGILEKIYRSRRIAIILFLLLTIVFSLLISKSSLKINLLDRFLLKNEFDLRTTYGHINLLKKGVSLFRENPIIGIGMGNFTQYSQPTKLTLLNPEGEFMRELPTINYIIPESHNIIVESLMELGLLGTVILMIIFWKLFKSDILVIKNSSTPDKLAVIISSWLFLISSLMDSYSKSSLYTFFILRGVIANLNK